MRDVDRLKEKIELSLDNRQVVSLVIGSLIVLGVVFLLGVMVGKQVGGPLTVVAPSTDVLAALDRQAQAAPAKVVTPPKPVDPPLTFQKDLTTPTPPAPTPVAIAADPRPDPKVAPKPAAKPEAKADVKEAPAPEAKSELVPEHAKLIPPPAGAQVKAADDADKADGAKADTAPADGPPAHVDGPPPALDQKLAAAFTAAKAMPKADDGAGPAPKAGTYTVQVAASQQKSDMDQIMSKLRGSGLRPYQVNAEIPGRGLWYRVRVGSFPTRGDAERYASDLKRETGMAGFVTSAAP